MSGMWRKSNNKRRLTDTISSENPTWQALQECQIILPLGRLLHLVPRFTKELKSVVAPQSAKPASTFFSNLEEGSAVVNTNSPTVTTIVQGRELPGTIVGSGSSVNAISQHLCDTLGIREWEPCPFWLRMADTSFVWPTGLIWDLEITIGGHTFRIFTMVPQLNVQGAYLLLLE